jgi:uncharacterized phosphosugar-binding protein
MKHAKRYYERCLEIQGAVIEHELSKIEQTGQLFADTIIRGGQLWAFGASHAGIVAEEMFYRTGGLALMNPLLSPTLMLNTRPATLTSRMERIEGFGTALVDSSAMREGDVILVHSVSGRNAVALDVAARAREIGCTVVVLTNMTYSKQVTSRHSSGKRLFELGDIVIDNHGDYEDAAVEIPGLAQKTGATSSVAGCMVGNMIIVATVEALMAPGVRPPVFHSANVDGGDAFNKGIFEKYRDRIHYM